MNINTTNFKLPKYFYEIIVTYYSQKNLKEFNLNLKELDTSTIRDLADFSFVQKINYKKEKAIFCLNFSSINCWKLILSESQLVSNFEINEITEQILAGDYANQDFWFDIENNVLDNLSADDRDFFLKYIQENSTLDNVLSKLYKRGWNNLLEPEIEILQMQSVN